MDETYEYDLCLSFAGEDRPYVEAVVGALQAANVRVFYDRHQVIDLWGKNLFQYLDRIYRANARFCIIFISHHYVDKLWPRHELQSAQARAFSSAEEYILPVRLDDTEIAGVLPTTGFIDGRALTPSGLAAAVTRKLEITAKSNRRSSTNEQIQGWDWGDWIPFAGEFVSQNVVRGDQFEEITARAGTPLRDHGHSRAAEVSFHDAERFCDIVGGRLPSRESIEWLTQHEPPLLYAEPIEAGWCSFEWTRTTVNDGYRYVIQATPSYRNKYKYFATVEADSDNPRTHLSFRVALNRLPKNAA